MPSRPAAVLAAEEAGDGDAVEPEHALREQRAQQITIRQCDRMGGGVSPCSAGLERGLVAGERNGQLPGLDDGRTRIPPFAVPIGIFHM